MADAKSSRGKKPVPAETKVELLPRLRFMATFDNALLTLDVAAGKGGNDAVIVGWVDAVREHDELVVQVEEVMHEVKLARKEFQHQRRLSNNWERFWLTANDRPDELQEYLELKPAMENFVEIFEEVKDPKGKVQLEMDYKRFKELEDKCEKLLLVEQEVIEAKAELERRSEIVMRVQREMDDTIQLEKEAAARITEDHVTALEEGCGLPELFPTIQVGFCITKINGVPCEDCPFGDIFDLLRDSISPHSVEFRRYDYRRVGASADWLTLQELRDRGCYVEDARHQQLVFIEHCREGNIKEIDAAFERGADPNWRDHAHNNGLHVAAARGNIPVMKRLIQEGTAFEARNRNMETPLLVAIATDHMGVMNFLLNRRAKLSVMDKQGRSPIFLAVVSRNVRILLRLLDMGADVHAREKQWGWTPLHFAANRNDLEIVEILLEHRASIYCRSAGRLLSPVDVADRGGCKAVADRLREEWQAQSAQCIMGGVKGWTQRVEERASDILTAKLGHLVDNKKAQPKMAAARARAMRSAASKGGLTGGGGGAEEESVEDEDALNPTSGLKLARDPTELEEAMERAAKELEEEAQERGAGAGDDEDHGAEIWLGRQEAAFPRFCTDHNFTAVLSIWTRARYQSRANTPQKSSSRMGLELMINPEPYPPCVHPSVYWLYDQAEAHSKATTPFQSRPGTPMSFASTAPGTPMAESKESESVEVGVPGLMDTPRDGDATPQAAATLRSKPIRHMSVEMDLESEVYPFGGTDNDNWQVMLTHMRRMLTFIHECVERGDKLLVHCEDGLSYSATVLAMYLSTKRRVRVEAAVSHVKKFRHCVSLTPSMAKGLDDFQCELDARRLRRLEAKLRKADVLSLGF
uniref:Tyrosine specific protein phosphatases domain-containing protein n=1 Tax=Phaeomonas parva TaxID=124430 RepID=A0A7S1XWC5_9STRA|mmetsp:Transcript_43562/g.136632  ORF Transcript_43562/g.136632 Transcript_43562/m.136632 type:complete len:867 (+) Transcript_43562:127-2727(+)